MESSQCLAPNQNSLGMETLRKTQSVIWREWVDKMFLEKEQL